MANGDSDALRLFVERARAVQPDFALTHSNAAAVEAICHVLEGIPLALELAAARLRVLAPEDVLARLSEGLAVLAARNRFVPERQQTMRAAIDWSYALLGDGERDLFAQLSVFADGWTLQAAEVVCAGACMERGDILDGLTSLVEKSLVVFEPTEGRYRLLYPVRQYAAERLASQVPQVTVDAHDRHAEFYLSLARSSFAPSFEASATEVREALVQKPGWIDRLERDHDNVRTALGWLIDNGQIERAQQLGVAFWQFWSIRGHLAEGLSWMARILAMGAGDALTRIRVLLGAGFLAFSQDDLATAERYADEALRLAESADDRVGRAMALCRLGALARARGDFAKARAVLETALEMNRPTGNAGVEAYCRFALANLAVAEQDLESARAHFAEVLTRFRELGHRLDAAIVARHLGATLYQLGNRKSGRALLEEALGARPKTH